MTQTKKTIWISRLLIGGIPLILLLGVYLYQQNVSPLDALAQTPSQIEISQGSELFTNNCSSCHGINGIGQNPDFPKGGISKDGSYPVSYTHLTLPTNREE